MVFNGLSAFPITPADEAGRVDTEALGRLLERLVAAGVDSIGLLGSTGTYAFLTREERRRAIDAAAECVEGRVPLIVGVGALRTDQACDLARDAEAGGASGLLLAPVSYNKLLDEEVYQQFLAVTEASRLPLCIYDNPGTTNFSFGIDLVARLTQRPSIAAIKMPLPANGDFAGHLAAVRARVEPGFALGFSGDWGMGDAMLAGSDVFFSVLAGTIPGPILALVRAAQSGDAARVRELEGQLAPLFALCKELTSLRVVYTMVDLLGLTTARPPRPILPLPAEAQRRVAEAVNRIHA
ncbi:dihydrodipicolinate synthase family protein [Devosia sediminis]|uniref:Dihydrodipicolinate synthase family protein n=1 Tax=Devosia sediminis TaxID=2798801 RepID=A0A934MM16_9HYPH|nr:dihydrodipicolinate synthase family protein [Devosia sediminis]MBJ3785730.1 dihydrodipicolinate synthase family protein [Devosia sediminis]